MTVHRLKTDMPHYQDVLDGRKPYEIRVNDRGYQTNDTLQLVERDPKTGRLTGRSTEMIVTHALHRAHRWATFAQLEMFGLTALTLGPQLAYEGSSFSPSLAAREIPDNQLQAATRILQERFSLGYTDWPNDERRRFYEQIARQILQLQR